MAALENRRVEFAIYRTAINPYNGKPYFPSIKNFNDVRRLPIDDILEKEMVENIKENQLSKEEYLKLLKQRGIKTE